jgi:hypothetical protein
MTDRGAANRSVDSGSVRIENSSCEQGFCINIHRPMGIRLHDAELFVSFRKKGRTAPRFERPPIISPSVAVGFSSPKFTGSSK